MMVTTHNLSTYTINKEDKFFFDTNIWMYMHCSIGSYSAKLVQDYSDFYQKVKSAGNPILTSTLLVSEFVNSYSRLEFNLRKSRDGLSDYKKDFRANPTYKPLLDNINLLTEKKILKNSVKIQDSFHEFEEANFFSNPHTYDFNDEYFCYIAEKLDFKIVTNDKDFLNTNYNIDIITR
ncbi:PIN domain-containing protein [Bacillus wiedmannii]|uniref:PIN domain-containing protein n=1 Tax=Bacillus wiedmannii TaxID=1890302 RepID=UPI001D0DF661|nr:PIN domain-containing protein [Bacillus wiedmannii]MCC2327147.1 PIN domain-containing protein [Bacillus wiedmannii]